MTTQERPEPEVGMPATIVLYTDTVAAVVVKVNPKSVMVAAVATGEERTTNPGEPYPVRVSEGILDQITGTPERYSRIDTPDGPVFRNGSIGVVLGKSIARTDYRH